MITAEERLTAVLMPLSSIKLLVGCRVGTLLPDIQTFNASAAACSREFFVSAQNLPDRAILAARIGKRCQAVFADAMSEVLRDFRNEWLPANVPPARASYTMFHSDDKATVSESSQEISPYTIDFIDCADAETASKIAPAMGEAVSELSRFLPLCRLDGITVARDYAAALRDLNRGLPLACPLVPSDDGCGVGVAMAPIVMRGSAVKVRVVLRADFGHALISADDRVRALGLHVLIHQLAHVACVELIEFGSARRLPRAS